MCKGTMMFFGVALAIVGAGPSSASASLPSAAQWTPPEAVAMLEISNPTPLLDRLLDPKVIALITTNSAYQKNLAANPGMQQFAAGVDYIAGRLGTDWQTAVRKLLGGGVFAALGPKGELLLTIDAQEPAMLQKLHETVWPLIQADALKKGRGDKVRSEKLGDVEVFTPGNDIVYAMIDGRLLISNRATLLQRVLDLRTAGSAPSLAKSPAYAESRKALGDKPAMALVNMAALKKIPKVTDVLTRNRHPLGTLVLGDLAEALAKSDWLALGLSADADGLALRAVANGQTDPSGLLGFTLPATGQGALPGFTVPNQVASISAFRDLHRFYATKDTLFPERTSGLIFFENMMGIFFSGRDLTDEIMGEAEPEIRFVVAKQTYDASGPAPRVQFPGFAVVFRMKHPDQFTEVAEAAYQKAIGLVNITRGQKALPGLIVDRSIHNGVKYSVAYYTKGGDDESDRLALRANFRPSLARVEQYLIVSSAEGLTKDLIDAVQRERSQTPQPAGQVHTSVDIEGKQVAALLDANRGALVRQGMLQEGKSAEKAEADIAVLLALVQRLGKAHLQVATRDAKTQADLELKLNLAP